MLSNQDMHKEIAIVDELYAKEKEPTIKAILKMLTLLVKLMHDVRTNQTVDMKFKGVPLQEPKKKPTEAVKPV